MPELKKRVLGTSREQAPVTWVVHQIGSFLIGELFNGGYYRECLRMAKAMASQHRPALTAIHATRKSNSVDLEHIIANLEDVSRWAGEVHSEGYHTVNTHVFITLWAAQEAGIENVIAEIIRTSNRAAKIASEKFKKDKYSLADWPWSESTCLDIAQKLDKKAINATDNGGLNIAKRTITLFSWFGLSIQIDDKNARKYNEASKVRNVILHRYGQLTLRDTEDFPELAQWVGEVLPITVERINSYYDAVIAMHLAIAKAVWSSEYK
jgi:hypothetical protein